MSEQLKERVISFAFGMKTAGLKPFGRNSPGQILPNRGQPLDLRFGPNGLPRANFAGLPPAAAKALPAVPQTFDIRHLGIPPKWSASLGLI